MNNGDTLFNWIQSVNSRQRSTTAGLLAIGLVMSSLIFHSGQTFASNEDPTSDLNEPNETELFYLAQTVRGFMITAFPTDSASRCEIKQVSPYVRHWKEFYRSWFTVTIEARCPGAGPVQDEVWIQCTKRSTDLNCTVEMPNQNVLSAVDAAKKREAAETAVAQGHP